MYIFEVITPGTWIDSEDTEWAWKVEQQLQYLRSHFFDANTALNLFTEVQSTPPSSANPEVWERDSKRRSEIRREIEQQHGYITSPEIWEQISFEADVRFKREKWSNGGLPREFENGLPFLYARAFLYALDGFDKFLGVLAKEPNVPPEVKTLHARMAESFPDLRDVRNTAQHLEDRARGLAVGNKPLVLKPVVNALASAPHGGVLILNSLNGSKYGCTKSDGHYGEIDVSPESMQLLKAVLDELQALFKWRGPRQHAPGV